MKIYHVANVKLSVTIVFIFHFFKPFTINSSIPRKRRVERTNPIFSKKIAYITQILIIEILSFTPRKTTFLPLFLRRALQSKNTPSIKPIHPAIRGKSFGAMGFPMGAFGNSQAAIVYKQLKVIEKTAIKISGFMKTLLSSSSVEITLPRYSKMPVLFYFPALTRKPIISSKFLYSSLAASKKVLKSSGPIKAFVHPFRLHISFHSLVSFIFFRDFAM